MSIFTIDLMRGVVTFVSIRHNDDVAARHRMRARVVLMQQFGPDRARMSLVAIPIVGLASTFFFLFASIFPRLLIVAIVANGMYHYFVCLSLKFFVDVERGFVVIESVFDRLEWTFVDHCAAGPAIVSKWRPNDSVRVFNRCGGLVRKSYLLDCAFAPDRCVFNALIVKALSQPNDAVVPDGVVS